MVACQRADKFLFSLSAGVAVRHDVDSYVVPQVCRARFLFDVCFEFLKRRFGFLYFLFQRGGAVSVTNATRGKKTNNPDLIKNLPRPEKENRTENVLVLAI